MKLETYEERLEYLKQDQLPGYETFGHMRHINQAFYKSARWRKVRRQVIVRDAGFDLGVDGREVSGIITVHHINPITIEDILNDSPAIYDPENLITVSSPTHKAIHYGYKPDAPWSERRPGDTKSW